MSWLFAFLHPVGVLRVLLFEKGSVHYLHDAAFIAKASLFAVVGLLSIIPTREFAVLILCAALMARAVGTFG